MLLPLAIVGWAFKDGSASLVVFNMHFPPLISLKVSMGSETLKMDVLPGDNHEN